jgi:hypothetical protein
MLNGRGFMLLREHNHIWRLVTKFSVRAFGIIHSPTD